jgi:hypothetical protein
MPYYLAAWKLWKLAVKKIFQKTYISPLLQHYCRTKKMKISSDYRNLPNFSWLSLFFPMSQVSISAWELTHGLPGAMVMRMDTVTLSPEEAGIPILKRAGAINRNGA